MSNEKKNVNKDVLESEHFIYKSEEPWSPSALVISELLNPRNSYVSRFSKKQIRFLSESLALIHVIKTYLNTDVEWLEELIRQYARLNKFEDGWIIKQAVNVARSSSTRMLFNLSRWKRVLYGEESD